MKKCIATMMLALSVMTLAGQTVDTYRFKMNLKIPRIYNNMQSLGYRKYQPQTLRGELQLVYKDTGETLVRVKNLENRTHKINGMNITYICYDYPYDGHTPLAVAIGNNKTGKFTQGAVEFAF